MWKSFKAKAEKLETAVQRWASNPTISRVNDCAQASSALVNLANTSSDLDESTASKLQNVERELAPIRRAIAIVEGMMTSDTASRARKDHIVAVGYCVTMPIATSTVLAIEKQDASYHTVPVATMESLIAPFSILEPLIKLLEATPIEFWLEGSDGNVAAANIIISDHTKHFLKMLHSWTDTISHAVQHTKGRQLAEQGKLPMRALMEALWALAPVLSWDMGLAPAAAHELVMEWSACMFRVTHISRIDISKSVRIDLDPYRIVRMLGKVIVSAVAAHAEGGDREELKYVHRCIEVRNIILASQILPNMYDPDDYKMFAEKPVSHDDVRVVLRSVAALRAAAAVPGTSLEFSVFAHRMAAVACAVVGLCLEAAADAEHCGHHRERIAVLCSPLFAKCLEQAAASWADMIRLSSKAPGFDFIKDDAGIMALGIFSHFFNESVAGCFRNKKMPECFWLSVLPCAAPRTGLGACALAARGAATVAAIAATIPAARALVRSNMAGIAVMHDKRSAPSLILSVGLTLQYAALGYAVTASAAAADASAASPSLLKELALASHASLHAALALKASGLKMKADAKNTYDRPDEAIYRWILAAMYLNETLVSLNADGDAPVLVALHILAAAAVLPETPLEGIISTGSCGGLAFLGATLRPVLVPDDVPGLQALLRHCSLPADVTAQLEELIQAAQSGAGLEQRQRRRLELLGSLPKGICANLACAEPVPVGGSLKRCSSCKIANFCSLTCAKYEWTHGHKAVCQALHRERDG